MDLLSIDLDKNFRNTPWFVWVLAPYLETDDPNLRYYYDFSQSIAEYSNVFSALDLPWKWLNVTIDNYDEIIRTLRERCKPNFPMVINLCDGDEGNGVPGISVIHSLIKNDLVFTGSLPFFYNITTSKIDMKRAFDQNNVPNAKWEVIQLDSGTIDIIFEKLQTPIIIKPAISAGSLGISTNSVVETREEFVQYIQTIKEGYRGWDLETGGIIAEEFIVGPEYTTFLVGSSENIHSCKIYTPVERVFHPSLPDKEKFLSFDRLWEIYENESPMIGQGDFYTYHLPDPSLIEDIKRISWEAYRSVQGTGYTRVDLRLDTSTQQLKVLEVNAQCGLSEDENYTSIGAILKYSNKTFSELVTDIMKDAYIRAKQIDPAIMNI